MDGNLKISLFRVNLLLCLTLYTVQKADIPICGTMKFATFAKLLGDVCNDVEIEPKLQPLEGETFDNKSTSTEDEARLDIKANGLFDSRFYRTFFDVKIFNPFTNSCPKQSQEAYKHHEASKKGKYEQRIINVENSFQPTRVCDYRRSRTVCVENHHKACGQAQRQNF